MPEFTARDYNILEFVARENITRFEHQLVTVIDDAERRMLVKLLWDERASLAAVLAGISRNGKSFRGGDPLFAAGD
jgi:hypothetical protein